ncbi:MAG: Gfo/Idh/MocA family oxidoreductase [Bacteroidales bacterium]|jgi:predicted dehydrogenase|nr:Gfo/Idh/MocA family oxidoreductase [Bacteroidales bacterium]
MLKIGVLGAGHLGKIHIKCIKEIPELNLIGFYDINKDVAKIVAKEYNITAFDNLEELISEVDIVDIVTPTIKHFECASLALKMGKHVFLEKPIVATTEEAIELAKIASEVNVKVQVGHVERFNPAYLSVKDRIKDPMFIEIHRLSDYNPRGTDVPVILDLMIHDIDILLHIVKSPIKNIQASGVPVISKTADIANTRIEFENGSVANLTASRISMKKMRKFRIFQHNSYIVIDFLKKTSEIINVSDNPDYSDPFALIVEDADGENVRQLVFENPPIKDINAIKTELESFYDAIINDADPIVTMQDGIDALTISNKINDMVNESLKKVIN